MMMLYEKLLHELLKYIHSTSMIKKVLFFVFAVLFVGQLSAQQALMLHSHADLWQSNAINPAFFPREKHIAIGLAAFALNAAHSGDIAYNDIFFRQNGRTIVDFGQAISRLEAQNEVFADQRIETISLGLRLHGDWAVFASHANRLTANLGYPKSLPELLWNGNAPYINQTVQIAPVADVFDWNEWSAGVSKKIGKVSIGARAKYLAGISALKTDPTRQSATLFTDPDIYQLTLKTDYAFHSSNLISAIDTAGLGFDVDLANLADRALFTANRGVAFDLGIQANLLNDRLSLSASVLDLGGTINWHKNAQYFQSKGEYQYDGVVFPGEDIINGSTDLDFSTKLDTLNDIFRFSKTTASFRTALPLSGYAGADFKLIRQLSIGVTVFHQQLEDRNQTAAAANIRWMPLSWFSLSGQYSLNNQSSNNIGVGITLTPGPVQLYFFSDNIASAFSIKSQPAVNFRTGIAVKI